MTPLIVVSRYTTNATRTLGKLFFKGIFECYTLEDPVRKTGSKKIFGVTAIPAGLYRFIVNLSPKFGRLFPRLMEVPGFTGILIHSGNTAEDSSGCILVGQAIDKNGNIKMGTSRKAFDALMLKINAAKLAGEELTIEVKDEFPEAPL